MCLSSSNSPAERVINVLTTMLRHHRLSMFHEVMEECMIIAGNSNTRTEQKKKKY